MSKRKVQFAELPKRLEEEEGGVNKIRKTRPVVNETDANKDGRDEVDYNEDLGESGESGSDEEGRGESNVMNLEDLEVEEKTVEYDEEVKITPFNLEEEMEEGHFDKDGTFVFNKKSNIKDSWLDEFDFNDVHQLESARIAAEKRQAKKVTSDEVSEFPDEKLSDQQIYEQIIGIVQPSESILTTVRRLGNATKSLSASERLKLKKLAAKQGSQPAGGAATAPDVESQKKQLARLTELADLLIRRGYMNAYQETFESLQFQVKQSKKEANPTNVAPAGDMFSDEFDASAKPSAENMSQVNDSERANESSNLNDTVKWEYKITTADDGVIHGPVETTALMELISAAEKEGKQSSVFYVRRHGTSGQFYSSSRVDFSLYID